MIIVIFLLILIFIKQCEREIKVIKAFNEGFKQGYSENLFSSKEIEYKLFEGLREHEKVCMLKCQCGQELSIKTVVSKQESE